MTQEQIIDAGIDYTMQRQPKCIGSLVFDDAIRQMHNNPSFEAGAEWAKKKIIEEACEWLEDRHNIEKCLNILTSRTEDLVKAFRQAMEE
jgi:hypothetical protein